MSHRDRRDDRWDDRRNDKRSYIPHKRSADDFKSDDYKRSKVYNRDNMDVDHHSVKHITLPKHLQYLMDSDKEQLYSSKNYDVELGLGTEIRKLEFDLELAELEVAKWENQILGLEQTIKDIEEF